MHVCLYPPDKRVARKFGTGLRLLKRIACSWCDVFNSDAFYVTAGG